VYIVTRDIVNIFKMSTEISTLCESFLAEGAFEGSQSRMLSEVISQVAALLEDAATVRIPTLEVKFDSLSLRVFYPYSLVPLLRDALECLVF
jgi:hypothetical protein